MIADFTRGPTYLAKGFSMITEPDIRAYVVIPLLINILLFGGLLWYGYAQFNPMIESVLSWVPGWLDFLRWIIWLIVIVVSTIVVFFTFTPFANIIAAPFNAIMAEKIEEKLTGKDINSGKSLSTIIIDSIQSQIGKLIYILLWSVGLLLISLIPVINFIAPFLWVIFGSWLLSLEYLDYPMGNNDLTFKQQKSALKQHKGLALGFGGSVMIVTTIPLVNFLAIPVAVAGATIMWVEQLNKDQALTQTNLINTNE